jgi:hypothetical protein
VPIWETTRKSENVGQKFLELPSQLPVAHCGHFELFRGRLQSRSGHPMHPVMDAWRKFRPRGASALSACRPSQWLRIPSSTYLSAGLVLSLRKCAGSSFRRVDIAWRRSDQRSPVLERSRNCNICIGGAPQGSFRSAPRARTGPLSNSSLTLQPRRTIPFGIERRASNI